MHHYIKYSYVSNVEFVISSMILSSKSVDWICKRKVHKIFFKSPVNTRIFYTLPPAIISSLFVYIVKLNEIERYLNTHFNCYNAWN